MTNISKVFIVVLIGWLGFFNTCHGQENKSITITGVILQADSLVAIPFGSISIKNKFKGTASDKSGQFSIIVEKFDTLEFSAIGFKPAKFLVPDLQDSTYSLIQLLTKETILLKEVEVIAWPDEASFIRAFYDYQLPKGEADRIFQMERELEDVLNEHYEKDKFYYDQMRYSKLYNTTGFTPPNNFLNPLNWSNFIRDWRSGAFKSKKK